MVSIFIDPQEALFIDWIVGLVSTNGLALWTDDGYLTHVDPLDYVLWNCDMFTSVFLLQKINDLLVDVSGVVAIAGELQTIDLCNRITAFDIGLRDHLFHPFLSIRILELFLKWTWYLSQLPRLICYLA